MNKSESKYFNTALRMSEALIALLEEKDLEYITVKEICHQLSRWLAHFPQIGRIADRDESAMSWAGAIRKSAATRTPLLTLRSHTVYSGEW